MVIDIAIIGAGPAGLYTAWRLYRDPNFSSKKIVIFDAQKQAGGRVLSVRIPELPNVLELGAMRYLADQIVLISLIKELNIEYAPFDYISRGYFLRGKIIGSKDFANSNNPVQGIYNISEDEKGKNPIELIIVAIQRAMQKMSVQDARDKPDARDVSIADLQIKLRNLDLNNPMGNLVKKSPFDLAPPYFDEKEWYVIKRYSRIDEEPLKDYGFWDLIQSNLSAEGYSLAHDGSGYQSILNMWNAADAIIWYLADFTEVPYLTLKGGMGELINRLTAEISNFVKLNNGDSNSCIKYLWQLKKISTNLKNGKEKYSLTFDHKEDASCTDSKNEVDVIASTVILALTQPALKIIDYNKVKISGEKSLANFYDLINSVDANPLCKILAIFDKPWWFDKDQENEPTSFKILTDLPLRMLYQFGKEHRWFKENHRTSNSCVLLAYSDARYADYWKNLHEVFPHDQSHYTEAFRQGMTKNQWDNFRRDTLDQYGVSYTFVKRFSGQLEKISGVKVPTPCAVLLKSWSTAPTFVGWHSWKMGVKSWDVARELIRPFGTENSIFTCGEAFSSEQGWIEGALKSADRVLEDLGVEKATWIDSDIYEKQKIMWI